MKKTVLSVVLICIILLVSASALAADYMFTSTIYESGNNIIATLNASSSIQGKYFMLNAYKEDALVASDLIQADFTSKSFVINCSDNPDSVKISIWNDLAHIKPLIEHVDFSQSEENGVQIFNPTNGFPEDFNYTEGYVLGNEKTSADSNLQTVKDFIKLFDGNSSTLLYAPDIDIDYYLGKSVAVTYDEDLTLKSIKELAPNTIATIENTVNIQVSGRYASVLTVNGDLLDGVISVYDDEVDTTNTEYVLDNANIIYNDAWVSADGFVFPAWGQTELLDNDGDGKYEFIFVTEYVTKVVDAVCDGNKKISMKVGSTIDLTNFIEGKDGYYHSIKLDGKEIDITDLKEYDVLSVAVSRNDKIIEIIVSRNVVKDAVEFIEPNANPFKEIYKISGNEYTIGNVGIANLPLITSLSEGIFYIDAFGKIAMYETDTSLPDKLAFIQNIGDYTKMGAIEYEVELLNKDGSIELYNLADNITVKTNATLEGKFGKATVAARITALMGTNTAEAFAKRIVSYETDDSGKITAIVFADSYQGEGLSIAQGSSNDEYYGSVSALIYGVTDDTIVFYLPIPQNGTVDKDAFRVADISKLVDGVVYSTAYLDINSELNAGIMIITSESISIGDDSAAMVTGSKIVLNNDYDKVIAVSFLQNGEEKTLSVDAESYINDVYYNPFTRGSIFEYSVNFDGNMNDARFCGVNNGNTTFNLDDAVQASLDGNIFNTSLVSDKDYQYIAGYVVDKAGSTITISNNYTNAYGSKLAIPDTANIYKIDASDKKAVPKKATVDDICICRYYYENGYNILEEGTECYLLIKYLGKDISDVFIYSNLSKFEDFAPMAEVISSETNIDNCIDIYLSVAGYTKTLTLAKDCKYNTPENNPFTKGSTFRYELNSEGDISEIYDESFMPEYDIFENLGFIQGIGDNTSMGAVEYEVEVLTKDGSIAVYNLAEIITVENDSTKVAKAEVAKRIMASMYSGNYASRLISYRLNSSGKINAIVFPEAGEGRGLNYITFTEEYLEKIDAFNSVGVKEDALVFYLPTELNRNEYEICTPSIFKDSDTYSVIAYNLDDDYLSNLLIVTSAIYTNDSDSLATVISSNIAQNGNLSVTFEQDGTTKTLDVSKNSDYYAPNDNPFTKDSTFRYTTNVKGEILNVYDENFIFDPMTDANLAFITGFGDYMSMGDYEYELEVLNKDGSVEIYNLADYVTVKENSISHGKLYKAEVAYRIMELMDSGNSAENFAKRFISYRANTSGEIISISFADANAGEGLSFAAGNAADEYDASVNSLKYGVTDATVIFYLPIAQNGTVDKDDFKVTDISMLVDKKTYDTAYLDIDQDLNAGVMVITSESIYIGEKLPLALVTGTVIATDENGDTVIRITFLQNGEEKTFSLDAESDINDVDNNPFARGSIFEYSINFEGKIDDARFCGYYNKTVFTWADVMAASETGNIFNLEKIDHLDYQYIAGYVTAKNGSILSLNTVFNTSVGNRVAIPSTANIYTIDVTRYKVIPKVATIDDIVPCKYYTENGVDYAEENADTYVLIKYIGDKIVDVIAYYGFAPYTEQ